MVQSSWYMAHSSNKYTKCKKAIVYPPDGMKTIWTAKIVCVSHVKRP